MFDSLANGGAGLGTGIEGHTRIHMLPEFSHSLALPNGLFKINRRFLAVRIRGGSVLEDGLGVPNHLLAMVHNCLCVTHPTVSDHVLSILAHRLGVFLDLLDRRPVGNDGKYRHHE